MSATIARLGFAPDTKTHDGLCPTNKMFEEYMKDVFRIVVRPNREITVSHLARDLNIQGLQTLRTMLKNLMMRCKRSLQSRAILLPGGGGSMLVIHTKHLPYLRSHVKYLDIVIKKVQVVIQYNAAMVACVKAMNTTTTMTKPEPE